MDDEAMKNYFRAVRLSLKYRWNLVGILGTSLLVALLWGANIGAVYPFMQVILNGGSIKAMLNDKADDLEASLANSASPSLADNSERASESHRVSAPGKKRWWHSGASWLAGQMRALANVSPSLPFPSLIFVVTLLLTGTIIKCVFLALNMVLVERLAQLATLELRNQFFRHTLQMELGAFGDGRTSDLMSRFTNDINGINAGLLVLFGKSLREPLKMAVCIAGAAMISWQLLLVSLVIAPLAFAAMYMLAKSIKRANRRAMEEMSQLYRRLSESFSGIKLVKAYTMERFERSRFMQTAKELYRKSLKIAVYNSLTRSNSELFGVTVICFALSASGWLILTKNTTLFGWTMASAPLEIIPVMLFYGFLVGVSDPVRKLTDVFNQLQRAAAAADRVYPLLDREPTIVDPETAVAMPKGALSIEFRDVTFGYEPSNPILRDISLKINADETIAIVGPNGCGKSTLANLLLRFYDPNEGAVYVGGVNLRDVRRRDLRRATGLVTQSTLLFDDTVTNNIRYGSPHASDEEVVAAAKLAHADEFIRDELPGGYSTDVGERGDFLSGGQRQRIALARAILRNPSLMILDEATSQVDQENEGAIHDELRDFFRERTAVLITHRTSTLELCDRVVVMDNGRITDVGSHEELLGRSSFYQRMIHGDLRKTG
jgi:ATP-binding cassette, subfamily B, bacterial MsbA